MQSIQPIKQVWFTLVGSKNAQLLIETCWQEIEKAYTSESRHYHNLQHIGFMLKLAKRYEKQLQNPDSVFFAIFYHDLVYNATSKNNELESAEIATSRLQELSISTEIISEVEAGILATKTHETSPSSDINFLLDFDLAILGADRETYQAYAENIRKEYSMYPDEVYNAGRKQALQHFLAQPKIFKTPLFQTLFEAKAHRNLQAELQTL